ncbi:TRAP transporter small permease [Roseicyclus persicicus]|uniref:TRAP transporter small permease protein n=1 Tax=Roseicyclus persicicus TaxID=2650661 RepID=A0A7X6JYL7_9RHOB|nr:TRAP transporter small permease [Roseibacterium persicicum]NKX45960.1 TRAP transporter small permease [Roseibacterium persicicum]
MARIDRIAQAVLAAAAATMMALVFLIIFVNSVRRYTTGESIPWGEEAPVYLAIYGVMFGTGLAYLQDRHIRFTVLTDLVTERLRGRLFAAMDLATAATGAMLLWSGIAFAARRPDRTASGLIGSARDLAEATGLPALEWLGRMGTWQAAIAVGGAILVVAALIRFALRLREV